jgi:phosphoadenosine phosphosulfate reductase
MHTALAEPTFLAALTDDARATVLNRMFDGLSAREMLSEALLGQLQGRVALVSSFGAESIALLHLVADIDPNTPVIFLETGMLFPETLAYQQDIATRLGLTDLRVIHPDAGSIAGFDPDGRLHSRDTDACCRLRKTLPLEKALAPFEGWITGSKRYQSIERADLAKFECDPNGRLKLNPLADWGPEDVRAYVKAADLPPHPLIAKGYPSIGCAPCTSPVATGEDPRAGRWRGADKTECGIHFVDGKFVRSS